MLWDIFAVIISLAVLTFGAIFALYILCFIVLGVFDLDMLHWLKVEHPIIPFKTFESLYTINPQLWRLEDDSVTYINYHERVYCPDYEDLDFSMLDLRRYHKFCKQLKKQAELKKIQKRELQKVETLEQLTKAWTADIEAFIKDNEQKMKLAKAENEEIIERILGKRG